MMSTSDHHSAYLAKALAALTPEGHRRVDELLEQLAEVAGGHDAVLHFATARKTEADVGPTEGVESDQPRRILSREELDVLIAGFRTIRDQETLDDVADWANAVVALLEDEAGRAGDR
jgi:hypothetical protein